MTPIRCARQEPRCGVGRREVESDFGDFGKVEMGIRRESMGYIPVHSAGEVGFRKVATLRIVCTAVRLEAS